MGVCLIGAGDEHGLFLRFNVRVKLGWKVL